MHFMVTYSHCATTCYQLWQILQSIGGLWWCYMLHRACHMISRVISYRMVVGWYTRHVTSCRMIQVSHAGYYREDIGSLLVHLDTHIAHIQVSIFSWQFIQLDSLLWLQGPFMPIFLSTGMRAWLISWVILVRSLWDFRHWIPGENSRRMDYSLGPFGTVDVEVIFSGGVMWHVDPTWHGYVAYWSYKELYLIMAYETCSPHHHHSWTMIWSSIWTLSCWPLGGLHTMYYDTLYFHVISYRDIVLLLGKGILVTLGPLLSLPSILCYVMSCLVSSLGKRDVMS